MSLFRDFIAAAVAADAEIVILIGGKPVNAKITNLLDDKATVDFKTPLNGVRTITMQADQLVVVTQ